MCLFYNAQLLFVEKPQQLYLKLLLRKCWTLYCRILDNNNISGDLDMTQMNLFRLFNRFGLTISMMDNKITTVYYTSKDLVDLKKRTGLDPSYGMIGLM